MSHINKVPFCQLRLDINTHHTCALTKIKYEDIMSWNNFLSLKKKKFHDCLKMNVALMWISYLSLREL